eukprot:m.599597 g.599597  ORF g.599597 m.599597 type:complete len:1066 (-) comp22427_c0_seq2:2356-5553(-)
MGNVGGRQRHPGSLAHEKGQECTSGYRDEDSRGTKSSDTDNFLWEGLHIGIRRSRVELCGLWSNCGIPTVDTYFTGRIQELALLEKLIKSSLATMKEGTQNDQVRRQHSVLFDANSCIGIQGMSGVGKTQLLAKYCYTAQAEGLFPGGIFWVGAVDASLDGARDGLRSGLCDLIRRLNPVGFLFDQESDTAVARTLQRSLHRVHGPWLLCVSNIHPDQIRGLAFYLLDQDTGRVVPNGIVVVTSTCTGDASFWIPLQIPTDRVITMESLTSADAEVLLGRRALSLRAADWSDATVQAVLSGFGPDQRHVSQTLSDGKGVTGFDGFPLALQLLGACMSGIGGSYTSAAAKSVHQALASATPAAEEVTRVPSMISLDRVATADDQHESIAAAWGLIAAQLSACHRFALRCIALLHVSIMSGDLLCQLACHALTHCGPAVASTRGTTITAVLEGSECGETLGMAPTEPASARKAQQVESLQTLDEPSQTPDVSNQTLGVSNQTPDVSGSTPGTPLLSSAASLESMSDQLLKTLVRFSMLTRGNYNAQEHTVRGCGATGSYFLLHRALRRVLLDTVDNLAAHVTAVHAVLEHEVSTTFSDVLVSAFSAETLTLRPETRHTQAIHLYKHVSSALERKREIPCMTSSIRPLEVFLFAVDMHEGRMVQAASFARTLEIELSGQSHTEGPRLKYLLGAALVGQCRYDEAVTHLQHGIAKIPTVPLSQEARGDSSARSRPQVKAILQRKLGEALCRLGRCDEARDCWSNTLHDLGAYSAEKGVSAQGNVADCSEMRLDDVARKQPLSHLERFVCAETAHVHLLLGQCWYAQGKHETADAHFEQSLRFFHHQYGSSADTVDIARVLRARALVQQQRGMHALAAAELTTCLAMLIRIFGAGAVVREIADVHRELAHALHRCGDTSGALASYFDSLAIQTQLRGGSDTIHADLATVLHDVGRVYNDRGELDLALHFLTESKFMLLQLHGVDATHPNIARVSADVAEVLHGMEDSATVLDVCQGSASPPLPHEANDSSPSSPEHVHDAESPVILLRKSVERIRRDMAHRKRASECCLL